MRRLGLLVALAACGGGGGGDDDGTTDDVTPPDAEATPPDAIPTGDVAIATLVRCCGVPPGSPQEGVELVSVDAGGAVRARAASDGAGAATIEVEAGGSVTAVYPVSAQGRRAITTITGVVPGDELTFGGSFPPTFDNLETGAMTVSWDPFAGAADYWLTSSCGPFPTTETSTTLVRYDRCDAATTDLLLVAFDPFGQPIGGVFAADAAFTDGGSLDLGALAAPVTFTAELSGLPPELAAYRIDLAPILDGTVASTVSMGGPVDGATLDASAPWIPTQTGARAVHQIDHDDGRSRQVVVERLDGAVAALTVDGPDLLPWISDVTVDVAAGRIDWTETGAAAVDVKLAYLYFTHQDVDLDWMIVLPPDATAAALPPLPDELAAHLPTADDAVDGVVVVHETDAWDDSAAVRASPEWSIARPHLVAPDAPAVPRVRTSTGVPAP